jgi:outer membrane protein OmpA-like peptidoglycan-associated protein
MTFPIKLLAVVAVWLLFYLITFRACQEELCLACDPIAPAQDTVVTEAALPLYFKWSDPEAYVDKGIEALIQQTTQSGDTTQLLQITGLYFEGEAKLNDDDNMGLARASEVARLFDGRIDSSRLRLRARQVEAPESAKEEPFAGALFEWVDRHQNSTVDRLEDRIAIRFPVGSANREYAPDVDAFLVQLAEDLKASGQIVRLTGHTDNTGSVQQNIQLGRARAEAIKQFLVAAGVPSDFVLTESKGGALPVAANETAEGRYQNRRVEVRFIQPQQND